MVARAEGQVQRLVTSGDSSSKLQTVRCIKNQCIGSRAQKLRLITAGAVPHLVGLLAAKDTDPDLVIQAIAVLGSLCFKLDDGASALLAANGLPVLLGFLQSENASIVKASARSLQFILQNREVQSQAVCDFVTLEQLVKLLASDEASLKVAAACNVANLCASPQQQQAAIDAGAVEALVAMLSLKAHQRNPALAALAVLTRDCEAVSTRVQQAGGSSQLVDALHSHQAAARLHAAQSLVQLVRYSCLPSSPQEHEVTEPLLGALVRMLEDGSCSELPCQPSTVPDLLARLLSARPQLHSRGGDTAAVPCLAARLSATPPPQPEELLSLLRALAELMLSQEPCRIKLLDSPQALPAIVSALELQQPPEVQIAATECIRALSRSAKTLRLGLCRSDVARPLAALLVEGTPAVQAAACAACCNLVLDFSPFKEWLVDEGALPRLFDATRSMDSELRLNGIWAAQNLAHKADLKVKREIFKGLPWTDIEALLADSEVSIRERTLNLLKNLVAGFTDHEELAAWAADKDNPGSGLANLLAALAAPLLPGAEASEQQVNQALLAISNLCTGEEEMQQAVMASGVAPTFVTWLRSDSAAVRESATWCIHNLALPHQPQPPPSNTEGRRGVFDSVTRASQHTSQPSQWCAELIRLGVPQALAKLEGDPCRAVRRNVASTLERFPEAERSVAYDDEELRPMPMDS